MAIKSKVLNLLLLDILIIVVALLLLQPVPLTGDTIIWNTIILTVTLIAFFFIWIKKGKAPIFILANLFIGPILVLIIQPQWIWMSEIILSEKYNISVKSRDYEIWVNRKEKNYQVYEGFNIKYLKQSPISIGYVRESNDTLYFGSNSNQHFIEYYDDPELYINLHGSKPSTHYDFFMFQNHVYNFKGKNKKYIIENKKRTTHKK